MLYHEKPPKYKFLQDSITEVNISNVKPRRSNITNRFLCPLVISKNIDNINEIYYERELNSILDLYDLRYSKIKLKEDGTI